MKKFILYCLTVLAVAFSCINEEQNPETDPQPGQAQVEMSFSQPATYASGDETAEEKAIKTLDLLVFKRPSGSATPNQATFVENRYAWNTSANKYRAIIGIGENLDIYCAVNARDMITTLAGNNQLEPEVTTYAQAHELMIISNPQNMGGVNLTINGLPMWGYLHNQTLKDIAYNDLGTIKLLRSVASTDITVAATNFTLEKGHIVFGADKGYLPFDPDNIENDQAKGPQPPPAMTTDTDWSYTVPTGSNTIDNIFYMYENDADDTNEKRYTKVVLEGSWNQGSGDPTFYPIAFRRQADNTKLQVTRNNKYVIIVTNVNGDGYPDLESAKNGEDMNMDYTVIPWNNYEDDQIHVIGSKFIAISSKIIVLGGNANLTGKITMSTNFLLDDFIMELNNGGYFPDPSDRTETENDLFNVTLTDNGAGSLSFNFRTLLDYDESSVCNPSTLKVTAGGIIEFEITIIQREGMPSDWDDGGEYSGIIVG